MVFVTDGATARCDVLDRAMEVSLREIAAAGLDATAFASELAITVTTGDAPEGCGGSIACTTSTKAITLSSWAPPAGTYYDYGSSCYEVLLAHELVHWGLWVNGLDPDGHHKNPKYFLQPTSLATVAQTAVQLQACPVDSETECKFYGNCP